MNNNIKLLSNTANFDQSIYDRLPGLIKECTEHFSDQREKDVILLTTITILSGCFTPLTGKYGSDWVGPNLFSFIVAPPASGKGVLKYPQRLGETIQKNFMEKNILIKAKYQEDLKQWKKASSLETSSTVPPIKPKYPVLFFPGNVSSAAIYSLLDESNGNGIICETEADTLTGAISQDWGNFSHILRGAFHHEPITSSRKNEDSPTYIRIQSPYLSVLLTGTPDQVSRLISSTEDGLFSRFSFYCYSRQLDWKDQTPCDSCLDLSWQFDQYGVRVEAIKEHLIASGITFALDKEQFAVLNENFRQKLESLKNFEGNGAASSVYRLGLVCFRIAMILSIARNEASIRSEKTIFCDQKDFETALSISNTLFEHSMLMYSLLPGTNQGELTGKLRQFYTSLPLNEEFQRKRANEIAKEMGISERSVSNYLDKLKDKGLVSIVKYGSYLKQDTR